MAENEYSDEYQFDDLDTIESDASSDDETGLEAGEPSNKTRSEGASHVRRNALIVVGVVAVLMLGYKFIGSFISGKEKNVEQIPSIPTVTEPQQPVPTSTVQPLQQQTPPPPQISAPVQTTTPVSVKQPSVDNSQINQKLSSFETSQQGLRSEVNSVNNKLNGINSSVSQLNEKIANLNQMMTTLVAKLDQQSKEIAVLTERTKPKPVARVVIKGPSGPMYYIQAIIPGRAWLIAANGSTITVREGTEVAGYGVVKLIDPNQGRVVTSSGRVIRFSQQDS